jgi:hypothetical protein
MTTRAPIEIFFSYSHKDEPFRDELLAHLSSLRREGLVAVWHDRCIDAGDDWKGAIDEHLDNAHVVLLLVSPDFMASDYCYDVETKRALERHERGEAIVVPVVLRRTDWSKTPFARLQAVPRNAEPVKAWPDRDDAWYDVVKSLRRVIEKLAARPGAAAAAPPPAQPPPVARPAAAGPAAPSGTMPTRASLRQLLGVVLRSDADLEAFCLDHFAGTHRRFSNGMDRVQKTSLLLLHEDPAIVLARLGEHDAAAVASHSALVRYE